MRTKWTVWLFVPLLLGLLLSPGSLGGNTIHHREIDDNGGWGDIADDGELAGVEVSYDASFKDPAFSLDRVLYRATLSRYIRIKGVRDGPDEESASATPRGFAGVLLSNALPGAT